MLASAYDLEDPSSWGTDSQGGEPSIVSKSAPAAAAGPEQSIPGTNVQVPTIFAALQEQLGLRLQAGKGQVEVLLIDHVQRPSPN
jgi:uncharacterized protein (TIGR03435 family)